MTPLFGLSLHLLCLLLQATTAGSTLVNRTIDDQGGDNVTGALPTYLPSPWNEGQTCFGCHLHPGIIEPSQAFNRTWSDTTYRPGSPAQVVQVGFTGSAVYVYNIVVDSIVADTDTLVNLTFFLDDEVVGAYNHEPISDPPGSSTPQVSYHVLVYSNSSLPHAEHALQMVSSGIKAANVLFDYVVYTTEDDPQPQAVQSSPTTQSPETAAVSSDLPRSTSTHPAPSTSDTAQSSSSQHAHTINTAAIVGAVVGGIGLILLLLLSFLLIRRRRIRKGRGRIRSQSGFLSRSARYSSSSYAPMAPYNVIALAPSRAARKLAPGQHGERSFPAGLCSVTS